MIFNVDDKKQISVDLSNVGDRQGVAEVGDLLIQWGTLAITPRAASTGTTGTPVVFEKDYAEIPSVQLSIQGSPEINVLVISAEVISKTGFTPYIFANNTTSRRILWVAVGKKA